MPFPFPRNNFTNKNMKKRWVHLPLYAKNSNCMLVYDKILSTLLQIFFVTHTECTLGYDEFVINSRGDAIS